jgi:threonine/homoserine/homoserine lactone efflux protein
MPVSSVLAFWAVVLLLIAVPGPDWAFTISAGLRGRSVLPAVTGLVLGYGALTLVVAAGVGGIVARSSVALSWLTVVGGCYLIWQGAFTARHASTLSARPAPGSWSTLVWRGIGVSGLNPKGLLVFLALLPQFADRGARWPLSAQLGLLGSVFMLTCAVFYACLGRLAHLLLHTRPTAAITLGRLSGTAMVLIGGVLIAERLAG